MHSGASAARTGVQCWMAMAAAIGVCGLGGTGECRAQGVETLGVRALGMGGAFVAVADDATATYWNPAGLPTAGIVSLVMEHDRQASGEPDAPPFRGGQRGSATFVGLSLPPLGVSYYRLRTTRLLPPGYPAAGGNVAVSPAGANLTGIVVPAGVAPGDRGLATSLVTQHIGVTLVQSIGEWLDVAGTIKYVHVGQFRAGLVARNLREPSFDAPGLPDALRLDRQVRAGVAWASTRHPTTVSCDVDLTRTETLLEAQRHVAVGAEHLVHPRLALRGGFRVNTLNDARPAGSAGVSVAVRPALWVDAQVTHGSALADRSWGLAARFGF